MPTNSISFLYAEESVEVLLSDALGFPYGISIIYSIVLLQFMHYPRWDFYLFFKKNITLTFLGIWWNNKISPHIFKNIWRTNLPSVFSLVALTSLPLMCNGMLSNLSTFLEPGNVTAIHATSSPQSLSNSSLKHINPSPTNHCLLFF